MKKSLWLIWAVVGLGLVFFLNRSALRCEFVYDDLGIIVHNPELHSKDLLTALWFNPFRAVVYFTYWIQWQWGAGSFGFRIFNLLIHFLNGVLLLVLAGKIFENKPWVGILASLGLWLNPIFLEAVNLIAGRFDLLMSFFYLLALICFWAFEKSRGYQLGFYLFLLLALFSKETAVSLPLVCLALSFKNKKISFFKPVFFSCLLTLIFILLRLNWTVILARSPEQIPGWGKYFFAQNWLVWFALVKVFFPLGLNFDYQLKFYPGLGLVGFLFNLFLGIIFFLYAYRGKIFPRIFLGYFLIYLPLAVIPLADIFRESRIYLPGLWLMLIMGYGFYLLGKRYFPRVVLVLGIIFFCFFALSLERARDWSSAESLWRDAVKKSPLKFRPVYNYANALRRNLKLKKAEQIYLWAERLSPSDLRVKSNLELIRRINQNPALFQELEKRFKAEQEIP